MSTGSPLVTVAMPARNAESTLAASVESLLAQTFEDFELIVVDHQSTDGTYSLIQDLARRDRRICPRHCTGTFVEAANLAWQEGSGTLIARMDADDVSYPDRLAGQVQFLRDHPELGGCGTKVRILKRDREGRSLPPDDGYSRYEEWINSIVDPADITAQRFVDSPLPNPSTMMRREILERYGGYSDPSWAEDYDLWLRLLNDGVRLGKIDRILLDWYDCEDRSTRTLERYSLDQFQEAKAHYLATLPLIAENGAVVCGAGPIGKQMADLLTAKGIRVHAFLEVNERQIGNQIREIPVLDSSRIDEFRGVAAVLAAVGLPGARERIRNLALPCGFQEGEDFFCVA